MQNNTLLPVSVLNLSKVKDYTNRTVNYKGVNITVRAKVRYDDKCRNGHNSFSITGEYIHVGELSWKNATCGCIHGEVSAAFPELAPFIKWHLTSTDGPMHYVANTIYWKNQNNLKNARECSVWPEAELTDFTALNLLERLPNLMQEFKKDVEELGFIY